jgi:hypothetical protein
VVSVTIEPALADLEYEAQTDDLTRLAKVALIVAAQRRTTLTVGELGAAIGIDCDELRQVLDLVLRQLANECLAGEMPLLPALVINTQTGGPGHGWPSCNAEWFSEAQRVFRVWGNPSRSTRAA